MNTRSLSISPIIGADLPRHLNQVTAVRPFAPPPAEWTALAGRLHAFRHQGETPLRDALIAAVVHGGADAEHLAELRVLAEGEARPVDGVMMQIVQGAVQAELFALYEPVALDGYAAVAKVFDDTADKFSTAAGKVDVEAPSEAVISRSSGARSAWLDALGFARRLDEVLPVLVAAAELCGEVVDTDEVLLALTVHNSAALHRRRLWEAFTSAVPRAATGRTVVSKRSLAATWTPPRCGRWSALAAIGAEIRAADITQGLAPVEKPPPMDRRQRRIPGQLGDEVFTFDPADPDYAEQLAAHDFPLIAEGVAYPAGAATG